MVWSRSNALAIIVCVVLPACRTKKGLSKSSQVKKSSRRLEGEDSIFTSLSENIIRDDVREQYAAQREEQQYVESESVKKRKKGSGRVKRLSRKQKKAFVCECARQQEAKLVDIPVPLNVKPLSDFFDNEKAGFADSVMLGYTTDQSLDEIADFYQQEMERHGWRCLTSFSGVEYLMHFAKPKRFCSISLRSHAGKRADSGIFIVTGSARTV